MALTKPVRGSESYVWFTGIVLGRGAMGSVHLARHRRRGTECAVKVFNEGVKPELLHRELEVLRQVPRHENIVSVIAIESETYSKNEVVIMEYCEGGSLHQIISKPEHHYGLDEAEFLLFFHHTGRALRHLYELQIIHRDVKPSNILLYIRSDGSHVYKLTDFGTARKLENGSFKSLCGTEEYLHPDMHHAAFIRRVSGQVYGHGVDLWSFGVTVYQCASGSLPFQPSEGIRQNKPKMHTLMSEKGTFVISQTEKNDGSVEIREDFPTTCQLSSGTNMKITAVVATIFNIKCPMIPQDVFKTIETFSHEIKICIFVSPIMQIKTIYLKPSSRLRDILLSLKEQTGVETSPGLVFMDGKLICDVIDDKDKLSSYPPTSIDSPIIAIDSRNTPGISDDTTYIPPAPSYTTTPGQDVRADAQWATSVAATACYVARLEQSALTAYKLAVLALKSLYYAMKARNKELHLKLTALHDTCKIYDTIVQKFTQINGLGADLRETSDRVQTLLEDVVRVEDTLRSLHFKTKENIVCNTGKCSDKTAKLASDVIKIYTALQEDKLKDLNHNEVEIHKYNMSTMKRYVRSMLDLYKQCRTEHLMPKADEIRRMINELLELGRRLDRINEVTVHCQEFYSGVPNSLLKSTVTSRGPHRRHHDLQSDADVSDIEY